MTAVTAQLLRAEFERAVDHLSAGKFDSCFAARPGAKKSALAGHGIGVMARALAGNGTASAPPQPKLKSALKQKAYQKKWAWAGVLPALPTVIQPPTRMLNTGGGP